MPFLPIHPHRPNRSGFTLVEMIAATAVLALIVAMLAPIFSTATSSTTNSEEKLEVDVLARQALDRIGRDLILMPVRDDLDFFLKKQAGNDEIDFFSRVPGVLPAFNRQANEPASGLTLVSYRVVNGNLERLAVAQSFDALTFLTYDEDGNIIADTGVTKAIGLTRAEDYHVLCEGVFRFELGFLLKDGSFAEFPMNVDENPASETLPGYRRWTSSLYHSFPEVSVPDGPGNVVFRPLGWQDVAAVVVTMAVIDPVSGNRIAPADLDTAANNLPNASASPDPADLTLPAMEWNNALNTPESLGVPQTTQNAIRIYQRVFFLNSP